MVARREWDRIVPLLEELGILSRVDGTALAIYCVTYARWVRACDEINGEPGMTETTGSGAEKVGPFVQIAASAERDMARMLVEFGCTPSSRSRISVPDRKPVDPLERFKPRKA